MADCASLPNAAEMVKKLRGKAKLVSYYNHTTAKKETLEWKAADVLEQAVKQNAGMVKRCDELIAENAKLKAELDAAINDIPRFCDKCKHLNQTYCVGCEWEWRGAAHNESPDC